MTVTIPTYCTRENVKTALDVAETARSNDRIDRAIESATQDVDGLLRRRFVPTVATRSFPWPDDQHRTPWRLWLGDDEVISVTSLVAGGTTITSADYFLEPVNDGPPYTSVEIDRASTSALAAGDTPQRAVVIAGLFGYRNDEETVATTTGALTSSATTVTTTATARIGVGDLLRIDSERVLVTGRSMVDTGQNLAGTIAAQSSVVTVGVSDGSAFAVDETLLIDSERMRVVDIAGNNLTVKRNHDGTVLAQHSAGVDVYALRTPTIARAANGSTAAAHDSGATVVRHLVPPLVRDLALAYALNQLLQEQSGYARVAGTGDHQREMTGRSIGSLERSALQRHGAQLFVRAV